MDNICLNYRYDRLRDHASGWIFTLFRDLTLKKTLVQEFYLFCKRQLTQKRRDGVADMMERLLTELQRREVAPGETQKKERGGTRYSLDRQRKEALLGSLAHILCLVYMVLDSSLSYQMRTHHFN